MQSKDMYIRSITGSKSPVDVRVWGSLPLCDALWPVEPVTGQATAHLEQRARSIVQKKDGLW